MTGKTLLVLCNKNDASLFFPRFIFQFFTQHGNVLIINGLHGERCHDISFTAYRSERHGVIVYGERLEDDFEKKYNCACIAKGHLPQCERCPFRLWLTAF